MKKRVFAMIMAAALCVGLLPTNALAAEEQPASEEEAIEIAETDDSQADDLITNSGDTSGSISISSADEASEEPEVEGETTLTYEGKDYLVTVTYADGTKFPAGAELNVSEYDKDSKTYLDRYEEAAELYGWNEDSEEADFDAQTMLDVRLFKIEVDAPNEDGEMESVEPAEKVQTTITYLSAEDEEDGYMVTYFDDDEEDTESLDAEVTEEDDDHNITFETDELSDFMVTGISEEDYGIMLLGTANTSNFYWINNNVTHDGSSSEIHVGDNTFNIIEEGTSPVDNAESPLSLTRSTFDNNSNGKLSTYHYTGADNRIWLLLDVSEIAGGSASGYIGDTTFDNNVSGATGSTISDVGKLRFANATTIDDAKVDVVITIDNIRLYGSYSETYSDGASKTDEGGYVNLNDNKIAIGFVTSSGLWMGLNSIPDADNTGVTSMQGKYRFNGNTKYTYPCYEDINATVDVVWGEDVYDEDGELIHEKDETVNKPFLQVASDIDIYHNNTVLTDNNFYLHGYYAETFKTLSGFTGQYYIYEGDHDNIESGAKGVATVQATPDTEHTDGSGTTGDAQYTEAGLYADTSGGEWQISYSEGWCSTKLEIYNYTELDLTFQKEDSETGEKLAGAGFLLYYINSDEENEKGYEVGEKIYYQGDDPEVAGESVWGPGEEDAKVITTGSNGSVTINWIEPSISYGSYYYLEEVTAPDGYQLIDHPIQFILTTYGIILCSDDSVKHWEDTPLTEEGGSLTMTILDSSVPAEKDVDADGDGEYGDSGDQVKVGDTLTYSIDFWNDNPATDDEGNPKVTTVTVTDVLAEGLDYVKDSAALTVKDATGETLTVQHTISYDEDTRTLTCVIQDMPAHSEGTLTFKATVNDTALVKNEIDNSAEVKIGEESFVTNTVWNPVPGKDVDADGDGEVGDNGEQVKVGDTLTYEVSFRNDYEPEYQDTDEGDPELVPVEVTVTDVLDVGLDYVDGSAALTVTDENGDVIEVEHTITYDEGSRTLTCEIPNMPAHSEGVLTFDAIVNENAKVDETYEVNNQASVKVGTDSTVETNKVYNPISEKDEDSDEDDTYGDSGRAVHVGSKITFTITYRNPDDEPATVTITDVLDDGLTYISSDPEAAISTDDDGHTVLTWTIENVDPHTSGSVKFTAEVNENALVKHEVENTAKVQVGNHVEKETNTVYNPIHEKDVDADGDGEYGDSGLQVQVGDTLTYIIYYMNSYDDPAKVTITDVLDDGLDFVSADNGGAYDPSTRTITWVIDDVPAHGGEDEPLSVTFKATVNETAYVKDEVDNIGTVQIGEHDPEQTNEVYNPVPEKSVDADGDNTYEDSGDEVQVGDMLMYKIDYFNGYDDPSTVTIIDELDEGVDFDSASDDGVYDEDAHTVTWEIKDVEPHTGGSVFLAVIVNKNALQENEITNTASIEIKNKTQVTNEVDNVVQDKDVDVDGDGNYGDSGDEVKVGDILTYKIHYDNGYELPAYVVITDVLDTTVDYVEGSASNGGTYDEATRTLTWTIEQVDAHDDGYVTFQVKVNESAWEKGEIENTGSVQVGDHDPKVTNTVYNPVPHKDVDIDSDETYGDSGLQVQVGDTLTYKIEYFNGEEEDPATVTITDELDKGLDFVSADNGGDYDPETRTITWVIEGVEAQTGGNVTFTATVNEDALEKNEVENTATVQIGPHDPKITNTVYNPVPGKGVNTDEDDEYDDNGEEVQVGDTLEYKIDYQNSKDTSATVTITDKLDTGLDYVEGSASDGGTYDESTRTITWVIEDVEAHTGGSVTFEAIVNRNALEVNEVTNTATVQVDNDAEVTNEVDNPVPDKGVDTDGDEKFDDDGEYVKVGDTLTYIINYDNADNVPVTVTITDTLDQGLDFVEASDNGKYDESSRTITWVIDEVPAHTNGSVTFKATVNENVKDTYEIDNTAYVKVGDHSNIKTNEVVNRYREYFPIDEEIVLDENDRDTWVKEESVNEYNAIELEMSTYLPIIIPEELEAGEFTMNFHNVLESHLMLDETKADFSVYIGGTEIDTKYYSITFDDETGDDCNFHVDVDLTALYVDGVISDDDLLGNTEIQIFFFADLEGTGLNGSYTSTVWYDVYDGENWEYTSNVDVVDVYTYEIEISKVDEEGNPLAGATFGIYYDEDCTEPVYRYVGRTFNEDEKEAYMVITGDDGIAMFYGLAEGTYYVRELRAPNGYVLDDEPIKIEITKDLLDSDHTYRYTFENTPIVPDKPQNPRKDVDTDGDDDFLDDGLTVNIGDELTYRIYYYNHNTDAVTVTITDTLDEALDFESATDGGVYDESTRTITWTIENAAAEKWGYVDFTAKVNDKAQEKERIENTAKVQIGNDEAVETNMVKNPTPKTTEGGGNPNPGGGNPKSGTGTPKTSDTNNIALWLALLVAAMAAVIVALRMRKRS